MSFKDIKGQDSAIAFLGSAIKNNRVHHAYIFLGPSGVGRKLTALNFAKALNCGADPDGAPCDACESCKKIDSSNHPDVRLFKPGGKSSTIKIEDARRLINDIALKPYEARKKVYILDDAASMNRESANALLKTLEEPPSDSVIILIVEKMSDVLSTISSRSQVVKFYPMKKGDLDKTLVEVYNIAGERAGLLSSLSSGRIGEALKLNDDEAFERRSRILDGFLSGAIFESEFDVSREESIFMLETIATWYRDLMVVKVGALADIPLINADRKDLIIKRAAKVDRAEIEDSIREVMACASSLDEFANIKLSMSVLATRLTRSDTCTK